jgi:hypothetical protein
MADEKPDRPLSEILAELAKRLPKEGDPTGIFGPSDNPQDWKSALEALSRLGEAQTKAAAQKLAAETNRVDTAAANEWFKKHWTQPRKCVVCGQVNWGVASTFAHLPESLIGTGPVGTYQPVRTIPLVVLTCGTCGNTILLNAIVMGLLRKSEG